MSLVRHCRAPGHNFGSCKLFLQLDDITVKRYGS